MNRLYPATATRAHNRCEYCRAPERFFNFAFEVEHILSEALGGNDDLENLALSCPSCNRFKGMATTDADAETEQNTNLFHPRKDDWFLHFRYDTDAAQIIGVSVTGRATVSRLRLNSSFQIEARRSWTPSGLYP